jgi:hypothetical protein
MEAVLCATASYENLLNDDELQKKLDRLARHKVRIERTFHRSLKELKALQTNTVIQASLPAEVRHCIPLLSSGKEISKRTQQIERRQERHLKEHYEAPPPGSRPDANQAASPSTT